VPNTPANMSLVREFPYVLELSSDGKLMWIANIDIDTDTISITTIFKNTMRKAQTKNIKLSHNFDYYRYYGHPGFPTPQSNKYKVYRIMGDIIAEYPELIDI